MPRAKAREEGDMQPTATLRLMRRPNVTGLRDAALVHRVAVCRSADWLADAWQGGGPDLARWTAQTVRDTVVARQNIV